MSVDLSKAKKGDTVKLRCGATVVLKGVKLFAGYYMAWLGKHDNYQLFMENGSIDICGEDYISPFDIIEVIQS